MSPLVTECWKRPGKQVQTDVRDVTRGVTGASASGRDGLDAAADDELGVDVLGVLFDRAGSDEEFAAPLPDWSRRKRRAPALRARAHSAPRRRDARGPCAERRQDARGQVRSAIVDAARSTSGWIAAPSSMTSRRSGRDDSSSAPHIATTSASARPHRASKIKRTISVSIGARAGAPCAQCPVRRVEDRGGLLVEFRLDQHARREEQRVIAVGPDYHASSSPRPRNRRGSRGAASGGSA